MIELRPIQIFIRAAESGSFRQAALALGVTPQAVSAAMMQLEKQLDTRLFHRTTRKLSLTEAGQAFLDTARPGLALLERAVDGASHTRDMLAGPLRVSASRAGSVKLVRDLLAEFCLAHPEVELELQISDSYSDWVRDRIDVGFRGGQSPQGSMIARHLLPLQVVTCASPAYLARHGTPLTIDDLAGHRCSGYRQPNTGKVIPWQFQVGVDVVHREFPAAVCVDDQDAELELVLAGVAIGQLTTWGAAEHLRSGRLVPLLTAHMTQNLGIYMYYANRTLLPLRTQRMPGNQQFYIEPDKLGDTRD
jgi:DNA-binding transcriptional LysR family regulator